MAAVIMGESDDRRAPYPAGPERQFRSVGKLVCQTRTGPYTSTASLVRPAPGGPAIILGTAHGFLQPGTGESYTGCQFYPSAGNRGYTVSRVITGNLQDWTWSEDWAVARLDVPAADLPGPGIPVRAVNPYEYLGQPLYQAQYNTDSARIEVATDCQIHRMELWTLRHGSAVFIHDCDARKGGSGGPVLAKDGDNFVLLGMYLGSDTRNRYYDPDTLRDFATFDPRTIVNVARKIDRAIMEAIESFNK